MPEQPTAPQRSPRRYRVPGARRFAAGALASFVAIFGVLALRVHDGDDPALAGVVKATTSTTSTSTSTSTTSSDPYDSSSSDDSGGWDDDSSSSDSGDSSGAVTSTPGASTSAS